MEIYIPLLVVLLLLSALFSSAETAFLSLQRVQLEHYVREGVGGAARALALVGVSTAAALVDFAGKQPRQHGCSRGGYRDRR